MNKITNEQLDALIKSAVNSSGPLPPDDKFSQIISALRELRELRVAMLQGADGNSPVIPDGWVACSERMPKKGQEVLCTDCFENYETALYDSGYIPGPPFFATTAGEFHPTHWMPLPAAPQQEVDNG